MGVILDTHTLLWALLTPEKLSPYATERIEDSSVDLFISSASAWEVATKYRLGKLAEAEQVVVAFGAHLKRLNAVVLPVGLEHALLVGRLEHPHRDPFDRMIAAQSLLESVPVLSQDRALSDLGAARLW